MPPKRSNKKDFDTEKMYKKLIPSLRIEPDITGEPEPSSCVMQEDKPEQSAAALADENILRTNLMEHIVKEKMDYAIQMLHACDCDRCKDDILAYVLNQLPPSYAVDSDKIPERIDSLREEFGVKASTCLINAIKKIKSNPHH